MTRKAWLYVLLVAATGAAVPSAGAAAPANPALLTGTTTISGSTTGYVPVVLPRDAVLPAALGAEGAAAIRVTGGGGFAGFALKSEDDPEGPLIVGGHSPASAPSAERPEELTINYGSGGLGGDYTLPAGKYRLYLLTGGKPTTVTLKFRGLAGSSRLKPTRATKAIVNGGPHTATAPVSGVGGVYASGYDVKMTTPFVQFFINKLDAEVHTETVNRSCLYIGQRPSGPMPYGPTCASITQQGAAFGNGIVFPVSDENLSGGAYYFWGGIAIRVRDGADEVTQDYGGGFSVTTASVVRATDYSQVWLELDAPPSRAAPARPAAAPQQQQQQQPAPAPAPAPTQAAAPAGTLPSTGLPAALAVAPALLLAAAAARRSSTHTA